MIELKKFYYVVTEGEEGRDYAGPIAICHTFQSACIKFNEILASRDFEGHLYLEKIADLGDFVVTMDNWEVIQLLATTDKKEATKNGALFFNIEHFPETFWMYDERHDISINLKHTTMDNVSGGTVELIGWIYGDYKEAQI